MMYFAKLSDGIMDQAPCISEAAHMYTSMVNLSWYEKFYFWYRDEVLTSATLSEIELPQVKSRLWTGEKLCVF